MSPICINYEDCFQHFPNKHYGTKTHTLVLVDFNNRVTFIEQDRYMVISDNTGIVLEVQSGEFRREFEFTIGDSASRQR